VSAAIVLGVYLTARETAAFGIDRIVVKGASPAVSARVRTALAPLRGESLVAFDSADGDRLLATVPWVASARYDRDFPHTLRVFVTPEQPVALLRRGHDAWVIAASARVLSRVASPPLPALPRVWLSASSDPLVGTVLADPEVAAVRALASMGRLPSRIRSVRVEGDEVTLVTTMGTTILFGDLSRTRLKLAVLARVLPLATDARYIDVSVPERVVTGSGPMSPNPQVGA
jgi:cell division protein FtsQ